MPGPVSDSSDPDFGTIADGGRAFPCWSDRNNQGMSLRDYFAAKAMAALLTNRDLNMPVEQFADTAYRFADAMLAERAKGR